jgi:hypothetical protein
MAAVALLPKAPVRIAVVDVTRNRPEVRDYLLTLDAFTVPGNGVICMVRQSQVLEGPGSARRSSAPLATVIWHEMAHLDGAVERGRQRKLCGCGLSATGWLAGHRPTISAGAEEAAGRPIVRLEAAGARR